MDTYFIKIAKDLNIKESQVRKTAELFEEGNTIPFISRYRKEVTGNLDETYVKSIHDKVTYYKELEDRKKTILNTIEELGKLTPELSNKINNCIEKTELEDIYAPYKPKKSTRGTKARDAGLEGLAETMIAGKKDGDIEKIASEYLNPEKGFDTVEKVIAGARDIIAEDVSDNAQIKQFIRNNILKKGSLSSKRKRGFKEEGTKFDNYFEFSEDIKKIPSHRILAMLRGENEKVLSCDIDFDEDWVKEYIQERIAKDANNIFSEELKKASVDGYKRLIRPSMVKEFKNLLKERADIEAVSVFSKNLRAILMSAPLGQKNILAVDPGIRTGAKLAVLSSTGDFLKGDVLYWNGGSHEEYNKLKNIIEKYSIRYIALGNGTGSREVESYIKNMFKKENMDCDLVVVNEAGASIYSASDVAREEFPELDLTLRGAISIGRRLQDPLAELVKIDPKSIGVGQYQHDVDQKLLKKELDDVVVSCVNNVGVNANTASYTLLQYVAGLSQKVAKNIVKYREEKGPFKKRSDILKVSGIGEKSFQQAAGFMRVKGENPLDNTGVHPDNYYIVEKIANSLNCTIEDIIQKPEMLDKLDLKRYTDDKTGIYTLKDIIQELKKPGRDPRDKFENIKFDDDVKEIEDLHKDMILNGKITNITNFGAFCDIGVHQDGLIHISEIANKYISSPEEVLTLGQVVKVKVLEVDVKRRRISLSMKRL